VLFLVALFSKQMVDILADDRYSESASIVPVILIGNSLIHIYLSYVNFTFYKKKTMMVSLGTLLAVLINIALNYYLIPIYGIVGAAWATVIAYFMLALFHYTISTVILKLNPISILLLVYYTTFLLLSYLFVTYIDEFSLWPSLCIKFSIFVIILIALIKTKVYKKIRD